MRVINISIEPNIEIKDLEKIVMKLRKVEEEHDCRIKSLSANILALSNVFPKKDPIEKNQLTNYEDKNKIKLKAKVTAGGSTNTIFETIRDIGIIEKGYNCDCTLLEINIPKQD